jgi:hypothetical protein
MYGHRSRLGEKIIGFICLIINVRLFTRIKKTMLERP